MRSTPASSAALRASSKLRIPNWLPSEPITRNSFARISWFIRIDLLIIDLLESQTEL